MASMSESKLPFLWDNDCRCMKKLDKLDWQDGIAIKAYGLRIGIRSNEGETWQRMLDRLPPLWEQTEGMAVERLYLFKMKTRMTLFVNGRRIGTYTNIEKLLDAFENDLHLYIAEYARRKVFVHAGVVGWQGGAILVPGCSYSGKTTLVAALLQQGAEYYSDEYAVIDEEGLVHPFARPLSMRPRSAPETNPNETRRFVPPTRVEATELAQIGQRALPVSMVITTEYKPGENWQPDTLSPGMALMSLLAHTVSAQRQPEQVLGTLETALRGAAVLVGPRGEAEDTVAELLARAGARSVQTQLVNAV